MQMTNHRIPSNSALGGAANEAGSEYRRSVAAFFVAHGLNGSPVEGLPVTGDDAVVEAVALETDFPVDDISVSLRRGRLFIQAKTTIDWAVLRSVADQWLAAVRDSEFDEVTDLLLGVAGSLSDSVRAASRALRRARHGATSYTQAEKRAVLRLRQVLTGRGASALEIEMIKRRAVILQIAVEEPAEAEAIYGRLLLNGHVVRKGEGPRAWRELLAIAGDAARLRIGHSMEVWLQHLRERGVPLIADVQASRAGYLNARHDVVTRYRNSLTRRGAVVDLNPLGIPVPPIPFAEMDAGVEFYRPGDNPTVGLDPLWTFRRHGRIVVTGLPGGGKSTTVANVAGEWASQTEWSLPIVVSLRRLAEKQRFRERPLRDQIVEMAAAQAEPTDRPLLVEALQEALRVGNAALFFDGLDEAADRSLLLIADIADLLGTVHPDTDVLIATRDVAYAATQQLGFVDFRLGPPRDVSIVVSAVLSAIATVRQVGDAEGWIAEREEWVNHVLDGDRALRETPLFPVLLASLAADSTSDTLPRTRALILERVVEDIIKRHETKRELAIAGIAESHHAAMLLGTFPIIATNLLNEGGSMPRTRLVDRVAPYLQRDWGLPLGIASATAQQVVLFWDEAGVFVAGGGEKFVAPRVQLLLEIGVALHAAGLSELEAVTWVQGAVNSPAAREAIGLAAGKSQFIADALIHCACELDDDALVAVAARAVANGGLATGAAHRLLLTKLIHSISLGSHEGWRSFYLVSALPVPADLLESVLRTVDLHYPAPYPTIARAYACLEWGWETNRLHEYLEVVLLHDRPILPYRQSRHGFDIMSMSDPVTMRIYESVATTLLPRRPDLAPAVAKAMLRGSMRTADVIATALRRHGHEDLVEAEMTRRMSLERQVVAGIKDTRKQIDDFLAMLRSFAPAAQLSSLQQRRLAELGSFIETLDLNGLQSWPHSADMAAVWPQFVQAVVVLGGFDPRVLAAQAATLEKERDSDASGVNRAFWSLMDVHPAAPLVHWAASSEPAALRELLLKALRIGGDGARWVAAKALIAHPDKGAAGAGVRLVIENGSPSSALPAVWAYLNLTADIDAAAGELAGTRKTSVREAVARIIPPVQDGQLVPLAYTLARDPVRQVQLAVLQHLKNDEELRLARSMLEEIATTVDTEFTCQRCGTVNPAAADSCTSCHIVADRPSKVAIRLLKKLDETEDTA
jgi:ribosomal protein L40E